MTRAVLIAIALAGGCLVPAVHAEHVSPAGSYSAALALERGLRDPGKSPSLNELRRAITAYEMILRRFPSSAYDDHALWQAAGLAIEAYDRYRERQDLEAGIRLLGSLEQSHGNSPFAARVPERRRQLEALTQLVWLNNIEWEVLDNVVRVTVQLDREVRFYSERLDTPPRLFFDFPGTEAALPYRNATLTFDDGNDVIRAIRLGRHPNHTTRVVLDTAQPDHCTAFTLYDPFRLVVDCVRDAGRTAASQVLQAAPIPPATVPLCPARPTSPLQREVSALLAGVLARRPPLVPSTSAAAVVRLPRSPISPLRLDVSRLLADALAPEPLPGTPPAAFRASDAILVPTVTPSSLPLTASARQPPTLSLPADVPAPAVPLPEANSSGELSLARQLGLQISRIVIDPGHGGQDPGARAGGLSEAALALDIAHRLEERLSTQLGLEVVMTRRRNSYLPLEARTALANRVGADLFLSIHANASRNPETRGVETYFLNLAVDPTAEITAARENVGAAGTMNDLDGLLHTIATNSKIDESRDFAETIQRALLQKLRRVDPDVPDLGVKQAPFVVLIGARMPSVLTEISFVTNQQDASLLSTGAYRDEIADALFDGIVRYQSGLVPASLAAWKSGGQGADRLEHGALSVEPELHAVATAPR